MTTAVQLAQSAAPGVSLGFKNRIINGGMVINQRNPGTLTLSSTGQYVVDRFNGAKDTSGATCTLAQTSTAPAGFTNSILWTTTTGAAASAGDDNIIRTTIEGTNFSDLAFGTSSAKSFTLSFWVNSSVTGTYGISLSNSAANRCYMATYAVSSASTWEYKTITVPGDTTGTWLTDTNMGLRIFFDMGSGSSRSIAASSSWGSSYGTGLTGGVKIAANTGATFYLTGVQLEVGTAATSFEYRDYGRELIMCQRYYWKWTGTEQYMVSTFIDGSKKYNFFVALPVVMRTNPTATTSTMYYRNGSTYSDGSITGSGNYPNGSYFQYYGPSAPDTWGTSLPCYITTGWSWSAEL